MFLQLDTALRDLGEEVRAFHLEDYQLAGMPASVTKITRAFDLNRRFASDILDDDVVEVAGNLGWRLFTKIRRVTKAASRRPLLITRLHGLEFKDEQARVEEEIAGSSKLSLKYKIFTRHWLNWQERASIQSADHVICHTSRDADAIVAARWKSSDGVSVVPLGVETRFRNHRDYRSLATKILWWGSWIERKGISSLPRGFEIAARARPHLTLTIAGAAGAKPQIEGVFAPDVRDRVTVLPFVSPEEHPRVLSEHDVFVFPSLSEGFGLALLEAMATGMPVITTFTGLAYDLLEHGRNAYMIPMSGPTALARAMVALCDDVVLRREIGTGAGLLAQDLTWHQAARGTLDVYALAQKGR